MDFQQKVREPFDRRTAADIDDVLGVGRGFLHREPGQRESELRPAVAQPHECIERADLQLHVGDGNDGLSGTVEKTAWQPDHVARKDKGNDLAFAVAQELVAGGIALLDEAELAEFVSVEDEIAPLLDGLFGFDQRAQAVELRRTQIDVIFQALDKGFVAPYVR